MRLDLGQFDKRRLARIVAVGAVALAAGHLVQTMAARQAVRPLQAAVADQSRPVDVMQLAASADPAILRPAVPTAMPATALVTLPPLPPALPAPLTASAPVGAADPCPETLDLMTYPAAMIGLTLLAPCHPSERVVLHHAGLAVTGMTTATGVLFVTLPALEADAAVEARFTDGTNVAGTLAVPDLATMRRFGVQWQGDDAFQVFGVEGDRTVSAVDPGLAPMLDMPLSGGFLTRVGDPAAPTPLLAEIYTFPAAGTAEVVVEAAVTAGTCGREILGETIASAAGRVVLTDLTLAMPECSAVGDFLVLNNLASDLTLASAN